MDAPIGVTMLSLLHWTHGIKSQPAGVFKGLRGPARSFRAMNILS